MKKHRAGVFKMAPQRIVVFSWGRIIPFGHYSKERLAELRARYKAGAFGRHCDCWATWTQQELDDDLKKWRQITC
jgi:hypothetical protein